MGKTKLYFPKAHGLGDYVEKDFPLFISHPINEIETIIKGIGSREVAMLLPLPDFIRKTLNEHGGNVDQKLPVIVSRIQLERLLEGLRVKLHQLLEKIVKFIKREN